MSKKCSTFALEIGNVLLGCVKRRGQRWGATLEEYRSQKHKAIARLNGRIEVQKTFPISSSAPRFFILR